MGLEAEIQRLKKEKNAVILAHNYQIPAIQDVADFVGDSLDLARKAAATDADYILFCGVDFMAETAAILNPGKTVLIPDKAARCPMAAQLPAATVRAAKREHPGVPLVLYINTLAEAKAEADIICTSANCADVVNSLDASEVLFGPDENMVYYLSKRTSKRIIAVPEHGFCITHKHLIALADVMLKKEEHANAVVLAHPECNPDVQDVADYILSTNGMVRKARELDAREFIIATEKELCYRLRKEMPQKRFYPASEEAVCVTMKKNTLEKACAALKNGEPVVKVDERIAKKARKAIERMLAL